MIFYTPDLINKTIANPDIIYGSTLQVTQAITIFDLEGLFATTINLLHTTDNFLFQN
ncbi:MAG: hypothetical protein K8S16_16295 [Bacteroidales bacterium]|nr:hypothetical protein [Bacteroidales bacterium]